ncbi:calponin homology domain-containing protein, partial [Zopfochytrium polystomum]
MASHGRQPSSSSKFNFHLSGAQHFWSETETAAYATWINTQLANDPDVASHIPIASDGTALFQSLKDGLILAKLINLAGPGTIDESKLNLKPKGPIHITENLRKVLAGATQIGVQVHNVGTEDIMKGTPHLCLGLVWQIIKFGLLGSVSPGGKSLNSSFENLSSKSRNEQTSSRERALLDWLNATLFAAHCPRQVTNFGTDLSDSVALAYLIEHVGQDRSQLNAASLIESEADLAVRAETVLQAAARIDCRQFASAEDIVEGNKNLNLAFVAVLHNAYVASRQTNILRRELEGLKADAQRTTGDKDQNITRLQQRLQEALDDAQRYQADRDEARRQVREAKMQAEDKVNALKQEQEDSNKKIRDLEISNATTQAQVVNLTTERDKAMKWLDESVEYTRKLEQERQAAAAKAAALSEQLQQSNQRAAQLQDQSAQLLNKNMNSLREESARRAKELEDQLESALNEKEALQKELSSSRKRLEEKNQSLATDNAATKELLRAAQQSIADLEQQARTFASEREESSRKQIDLEAKVQALTLERQSLQQQLASKNSLSEQQSQFLEVELSTLKEQLRSIEQRNADLQRQNRSLSQEKQDAADRAKELEE